MSIFKLFGHKNKDNIKEEPDKIEKIAEIAVPAKTNDIEDGNDENEEELIAVITAAVSAVLQKSVSGFRVVSFKQKHNWKNSI